MLTAIQPSELGRMMRERAAGILRMKASRLALSWTKDFSLPQIISACDRISACLGDAEAMPSNVQCELIRNQQFASWLAGLLALTQEKAEACGEAKASVCRSGLLNELDDLLEACRPAEKNITNYSATDVMYALEGDGLTGMAQLAYLENFAPMALPDGERAQIRENLSVFETVPIALDGEQRTLLSQPFVGTRHLFVSSDLEEVSAPFRFCSELSDIAQLLHQKGIDEYLTLTDYQYFAEDGAEYLRLLTSALEVLDGKAAADFIWHWQQNHCALFELQRMERRMRTAGGTDWAAAFSSYVGYVNLLYGSRFKTISLEGLAGNLEDILTYAITHNKKHFIRLVDENADRFLGLSRYSILFDSDLYRIHFNLNELTARDLDDCGWMVLNRSHKLPLADGRRYTFPELKLLYDVPEAYATLYHKLRSPSLDHRIKVLRQLRKRNVLRDITGEAELSALAALLDQKTLHDWRREEFGHIRGLRAEDAARMLIHMDQLRHLLPGIRNRTDVMLALRSLEHLARFDSMDALKAGLLELDQDWLTLSANMDLSREFITRYQEGVVRFLSQDGAGIAWTYLEHLGEKLRPAFHRVVKAELMGQFGDLKYHEGDLEQELDYPLDTQAKVEWRENLMTAHNGVTVQERDDFFSTILLGTQPYATCLSYCGGSYCSCLLACFDSNKKVLYAERDGQIVGRACIRLTKCCLTGAPKDRKEPAGRFSFVDLEEASGSQDIQHQDERLALFLERPYICGIDPEEQLQVNTAFVTLARQKARALGAMLVLNLDYREAAREGFAQTSLHLYISASKAGGQYLDSLGGEAAVSSEGSYKKNAFLVEQAKSLPEKIGETMCA